MWGSVGGGRCETTGGEYFALRPHGGQAKDKRAFRIIEFCGIRDEEIDTDGTFQQRAVSQPEKLN